MYGYSYYFQIMDQPAYNRQNGVAPGLPYCEDWLLYEDTVGLPYCEHYTEPGPAPIAVMDRQNGEYLLPEPLIVEVNEGCAIECCLTNQYSIGFTYLDKKSATTINDTMKNLVGKLGLRGRVKEVEMKEYHFIPIDCLVEDEDGKPMDVSRMISIVAKLTMKLLGVVDHHTQGISPILKIHKIVLVDTDE